MPFSSGPRPPGLAYASGIETRIAGRAVLEMALSRKLNQVLTEVVTGSNVSRLNAWATRERPSVIPETPWESLLYPLCYSFNPAFAISTLHPAQFQERPQLRMSNLPLPQFYGETLSPLLPIIDDTLSSTDPSAQTTLATALDNLHLIGRMITSLGVFSENESADELGDGEIRFMSLGWVIGECEGKQGLGGRDDRMNALKRSEVSCATSASSTTADS